MEASQHPTNRVPIPYFFLAYVNLNLQEYHKSKEPNNMKMNQRQTTLAHLYVWWREATTTLS